MLHCEQGVEIGKCRMSFLDDKNPKLKSIHTSSELPRQQSLNIVGVPLLKKILSDRAG